MLKSLYKSQWLEVELSWTSGHIKESIEAWDSAEQLQAPVSELVTEA